MILGGNYEKKKKSLLGRGRVTFQLPGNHHSSTQFLSRTGRKKKYPPPKKKKGLFIMEERFDGRFGGGDLCSYERYLKTISP